MYLSTFLMSRRWANVIGQYESSFRCCMERSFASQNKCFSAHSTLQILSSSAVFPAKPRFCLSLFDAEKHSIPPWGSSCASEQVAEANYSASATRSKLCSFQESKSNLIFLCSKSGDPANSKQSSVINRPNVNETFQRLACEIPAYTILPLGRQ